MRKCLKSMSDKENPLSKEDAALWQKVKNSLDPSTPIKKKAQPQSKPKTTPTTSDFAKLLDEDQSRPAKPTQAPKLPAETTTKPRKKTAKPIPKIESFNPQDSRNLSSGKQSIEGIIDLHGHRQAEAEQALRSFVKRAQADGKRFILVITGKGQHKDDPDRPFELGAPEPGVLRRKVPNWLEDMSKTVLSYKTAHKNHGGSGALYVRLRRLK